MDDTGPIGMRQAPVSSHQRESGEERHREPTQEALDLLAVRGWDDV